MMRELDHDTLRITTDVTKPRLLISLEGELDIACADLVLAMADADLADLSAVTIDISRLTFCDSSGLRALMHLRAVHERAGRAVQIVGAKPNVRRVTAILREDHHLAS